MTTTDTEAMSALHELLDERQRYQGWLATLEGRRSSTPPHVYERVQQDYVSRLDRVMQSLAERASQLSGTIGELTSELATLRQHESDKTDERHEAELRAAVGEFTPDDWERRRADADSDLEQIAAERHSLESELDELQRIVALTRSIRPAGAAEVASPATAEQPSDAAEGPVGAASETGGAGRGEPAQSIEDFIAEWHPPQARQGEAGQSAPAASQPGSDNDSLPDTSDLDHIVIPASPMGGNPVGAAGADYGIKNGVTGLSGGLNPAPPTRTPPVVPAAVADSRRDSDKTLRCPECGAMNYATEWYCERCGGELSTF